MLGGVGDLELELWSATNLDSIYIDDVENQLDPISTETGIFYSY